MQITAAGHSIKADCNIGVTAVGYTFCDILDVAGDPANKWQYGVLRDACVRQTDIT